MIEFHRKLLPATYRAARRTKKNRSALIQEAVREHLRALKIRELERRDHEGYAKHPQSMREAELWAAVWPPE